MLVRLVLVSVLCCLLDLAIIMNWVKTSDSHSSLPAGFQRRHIENCVVRIDLVRLVLGDDDAFPDGHGELALGRLLGHPRMLQICPCWNSYPEFVELSVVFEIILAFSVWSILF